MPSTEQDLYTVTSFAFHPSSQSHPTDKETKTQRELLYCPAAGELTSDPDSLIQETVHFTSIL